MGKNVAVFVDVANIFYAAKAAGVDIDYVTLLKASSAGRDLVRAYAYTGLDPDNENQRNFHEFLRRHGYKVVSKDIRKYGDGKVKANLDIELVVDMMKTARNLDIAIVVSGDGDFAPAIRAVQEQGVRVEVVSFRGNTSSDLMDVADQFTDITQIAKVEKGSSRSGRRVADDDADLSMTEVPDKQSEGTGERGRGRGRTRRTGEDVAAARGGRGRGRIAAAPVAIAASNGGDAGEGTLIVLPGEKLSRAAAAPAMRAEDLDEVADGDETEGESALENGDGSSEEARRRRRRRGGRGRGRGRAREDGTFAEDGEPAAAVAGAEADEDEPDVEQPAPSRRAASAFGSVWDSQIGVRSAASSGRATPAIDDDEDFDEPAVPEYLLTERRQRDAGRGGQRGGGRGRGGAYAAALDRERFGGGRGSTPSRFAEPAPRREGGFGRPDRGGRNERPDRGDRGGQRPFRDARPAPRPSGDEPWSEVPPEIEAMLRAQIESRPSAPARAPRPEPEATETVDVAAPVTEAPAAGTRRGRRPAASSGEEATATSTSTRTRTRRTAASSDAAATEGTDASAGTEASAAAPKRATTRRTRSTSTATTAEAAEGSATDAAAGTEASTAAPRRRTSTRSRTTATSDADAAASNETAATEAGEATAAPKRRTTRRKTTEPDA